MRVQISIFFHLPYAFFFIAHPLAFTRWMAFSQFSFHSNHLDYYGMAVFNAT